MKALVIGAGIAGLATAHELVRRGVDARVLERESQPFAHSSGSNAAIYRPIEGAAGVAALALRSAELLDQLCGSRAPWLGARPLWLVASATERLAGLEQIALAHGIEVERIEGAALDQRQPLLARGNAGAALIHSAAGVMDPHAVATTLMGRLRGRVELGVAVARIAIRSGKVVGVVLESGEERSADAVVIAAGAWSSTLAPRGELSLPLSPLRRHLVVLDPAAPLSPSTATIWDVEAEIYFRPESGGLLASPCDEQAWPAEPPTTDPMALELLATKLARLSPALTNSRVKRSWACLRTFAPDRAAVLGRDPRIEGLAWTAGLGGFGMSVGLAAGELAARSLLDEAVTPEALSVERLLR